MRTIQIVSSLDDGGVETLLRGIIDEFTEDTSREFIFIKHSTKTGILEEYLLKRGYPIYYVPGKTINLFYHIIQIYRLFLRYRPDMVHVHMNENSWLDLLIAKTLGIKYRIGHIHLYDARTSFARKQLNYLFGFLTDLFSTKILVCSVAAARAKGISKNFIFYPNAISVHRFSFNSRDRMRIRESLGLEESDILIGLTARLYYQKNQIFLLNLLTLLENRYKLLLIGGGEDMNLLQSKARALKIDKRVFLIGSRSDISCWYSAMDIFAMPSLFEGFGISLLEAQINGLPCLVSKVFPEEVILSNSVLSLDLDLNQWKEAIHNISIKRDNPNLELFSLYDADKAFKGYFDLP